MMKKNIQAEWLKEKRSANRKMLFLVPLIFMLFCFILTMMMGFQLNGQSFLAASAFNWYPLLILPVIVALMVANSYSKEKQQQMNLYQSHGFSLRMLYLGKVCVVTIQFAIILAFSFLLYCFLSFGIFQDQESLSRIILAFLVLFCGGLPVLALSFLLVFFIGRIPMLLLTFVGSQVAAIFAVQSWWFLFPWCYSLRMMAAVMKIHPNGLYITDNSNPMLNTSNFVLGCLLSLLVFVLVIAIGSKIIARRENGQ